MYEGVCTNTCLLGQCFDVDVDNTSHAYLGLPSNLPQHHRLPSPPHPQPAQMTELQFHYPMPHASLDRSLHAFSHLSNPHHSKYDQPLLPLPHQQSTQTSLRDTYPALQRFATDQLTPPLDMNASHGVAGYNGGYPSSRTGEPSGAARVMEADLYSDHKTGSWASGSQYGTRSRGPASPVSVQPNLAVPDNSHRRTRSSNAIAPSLQIPRTISTPQGGMPQLAAEVGIMILSLLRFWI